MTDRSSVFSPGSVPAPILVQTAGAFAQMCRFLQQQPLLALDTESDSLFRYYPRVCLIQISAYADPVEASPQRVVDYLVDPLQLKVLDELGSLLADPQVEIILHAAENDLLLLQRDFHFTVTTLFDTQLAGRILGWKRVGLAAILAERFGAVSDKRMQRTNWGNRPLTPQQMTYAQQDTHYLPALRRQQIELLKEAGRWEEAQEAFRHLTQLDFAGKGQTERTFWQMKSSRDVPRDKTGVLEEVWLWREAKAQILDRPPFKVVDDRVLAEIAHQQPAQKEDLANISGLSDHQLRRFGEELLQAVQRGQERPLPELPDRNGRNEPELDEEVLERYDALRRWRTNTAEKRGVDPDIVFSNDILLAIAQEAPQSVAELESMPAIGPWKARTYGRQVTRLVSSLPSAFGKRI
jgi:ribonuclease D